MNLRKHPPERRRRTTTLYAQGCCCCCCCCLHSLGGLIGSTVASVKARTEEERRTVKAYWLLFFIATGGGMASFAAQEPNFSVVSMIAALTLPAAQLFASFLVVLANMVWALDLNMLARITWKGFLWAFVGMLIMGGLLVLFAR